ncbi:pentapeptide repeat-containing protein [Tsukamurella sputi]|uniref:Pentapeptide repeat-containing protein n=1 Tax=Tsukamurella sputi TaxID=2591848 RepID=A0A5C5RVX5_9ACTN|nr:pentapeptide repeat-containing protein [Tsukamurella sputi]
MEKHPSTGVSRITIEPDERNIRPHRGYSDRFRRSFATSHVYLSQCGLHVSEPRWSDGGRSPQQVEPDPYARVRERTGLESGVKLGYAAAPPADASEADESFSGASLAGASFTGASFAGASFTGASFAGASAAGVSFTGASFAGASVAGVVDTSLAGTSTVAGGVDTGVPAGAGVTTGAPPRVRSVSVAAAPEPLTGTSGFELVTGAAAVEAVPNCSGCVLPDSPSMKPLPTLNNAGTSPGRYSSCLKKTSRPALNVAAAPVARALAAATGSPDPSALTTFSIVLKNSVPKLIVVPYAAANIEMSGPCVPSSPLPSGPRNGVNFAMVSVSVAPTPRSGEISVACASWKGSTNCPLGIEFMYALSTRGMPFSPK